MIVVQVEDQKTIQEQKEIINKKLSEKEIRLNEYHSRLWIENEKKKYKNEKVIFILPNGKKIK